MAFQVLPPIYLPHYDDALMVGDWASMGVRYHCLGLYKDGHGHLDLVAVDNSFPSLLENPHNQPVNRHSLLLLDNGQQAYEANKSTSLFDWVLAYLSDLVDRGQDHDD